MDLKSSDPALVAAVAELVAAQPGRERLLLWGSFHQRTAAACLAAAPGLPLFASMQRALVMMVGEWERGHWGLGAGGWGEEGAAVAVLRG